MKHSDTLTELFAALSKAQGQIRPAAKDATNPHLKSKYADLSSIWEACRAALAANGLSISQWPTEAQPGHMALTTVLAHSSGEYMMETYTMPLGKSDPQTAGSTLTYAKRYALASVLGIVGSDDDDGNAASQPRQQASRPAPAQAAQKREPEAVQKASGEVIAINRKLVSNFGFTPKDRDNVLSFVGYLASHKDLKSTKDLSETEAQFVLGMLNGCTDRSEADMLVAQWADEMAGAGAA